MTRLQNGTAAMQRVTALALLSAAWLLPGCEPARAPAPVVPPVSSSAPSQVDTLAGEWRVAGIDGRAVDEVYGLALSADARAIWWQPRCAGVVRGYAIEGERIVIGPDPDLSPRRAGEPTRPVCAIGLPPRLDDVLRALDAAETIRRTPSNGIELSGGGRTLLLFSQ